MEASLKNNLFWDYLNRFGTSVFGLIINVILARLLTPGEFGLVGVAMAINGIAGIFLNLGIVNGIIQSHEVNNKMLSTAFYLNLLMSFFIYLNIFFFSKTISNYYGIGDLEKILKISAIAFILNAMSLISYAQLNREMKFKLIAMVDLISLLISGSIGIIMALNDYGIWSIVIQQLANSFIMFFCFFYVTKWLPIFYFKFNSIRELLKFSKFIFVTNLLDTVFSKFDILLIGKVFNLSTLGYYTRAQGLELTIRSLTSSSLLVVLFPAFRKLKDNTIELKKSYYEYFELISFLFFLIAGVFFISSHQVFLILFGPNWGESAVFFKIMILAGFAFPLGNLAVAIMQSRGNSKSVLKLEILKKLFLVPVYFIAFYYGIKMFLISCVFLALVNTFLGVFILKSDLDVSVNCMTKILFKYLLTSFLVIAIIEMKSIYLTGSNSFFYVLIDVVLYLIAFLTFHYFSNSKGFVYALRIFKKNQKNISV